MRTPRSLFATLLAIAPLLPSAPAAAQTAPWGTYQLRFDEAACPFEASPQVLEQVRCGYLTVPQNRAEPDGRQLRLAVAVLKSTSPTPRSDPIVFLSGGPGTPSLRYVPARLSGRADRGLWPHLREDRDLVFFDPRGVGHSEPRFCPEVTEEFFQLHFLGMDGAERLQRQRQVLARCAQIMSSEDVDLSQYNSVTGALDLQDLREALGYGEWNLFGSSYGTRLALEAMRSTPEGIRSVVLDAPAPPNVPRHAKRAESLAEVVHRLAALCASETTCNAGFPDLESRVWRTVEVLDAEPLRIRGGARSGLPDPIVFDGLLFAQMLYLVMNVEPLLPFVPVLVREVERRNTALVLILAKRLGGGITQLDRALHLAVECYESAPFNGLEARPGTHGPGLNMLDRVDFVGGTSALESCDAWHRFRASPEAAEPVHSEIPTLIVTGEFDPATHRSYGPMAALALTHSHVVDIRGAAHGAASMHPCTHALMTAFFHDPTHPVDDSCVTEMEAVRFVTDVRVAPGVGRLASTLLSTGGSRLQSAAMGLPLLVLLGSVVGWPMATGVARLRRREGLVRTPFERRAMWGAYAIALLALAFLAGLAWVTMRTMAENPMILLFGVPGWAAPLLVIPWVLLAGSMALVATAALAWRRGAWTRWGRIHFTLVAGASLALATLLIAWGIV
jgi:pimeloyl-ACP methyl ester carboxylesterase